MPEGGNALVKPRLPFFNLAARHKGLTEAIADCYSEAARVCLDRHHQSPVDLSIEGTRPTVNAMAEWDATDEVVRAAWANETDTTEMGAYACVLAAVEIAIGLVAIRRAETLTGADYYVAPPGSVVNDLEDCVRLEISGMDKGSGPAVQYRVKAKLDQAARGDSNLPAIAGVIGFQSCLIVLRRLGE